MAVAFGSSQTILAAIQRIGETFTATLRLDAVLDQLIESGIHLAGCDSGSVMLLSEDARELVVAAAVGRRAPIIIGTRQPASASVAGQALRTNDPILVRGMASGAGGPSSDHPQDLGWGLVLPLRVSGRLVGVLNLNTQIAHGDLPAEALSLLSILASQASIMIEIGRLYQDLERKERRLELFVDRFLRVEPERRPASVSKGPSNGQQPTAESPREDSNERLSGRELEVLALIVEGLTNKEIAGRLCLAPDTVKNHVVHIIHKLGANDRTHAAVMAIRQGLVG